MNHPDIEARIDAQLDGELEAAEAETLAAHVAGCDECRRFRDARLALRSAIAGEIPRYRAPSSLRSSVQDAVRKAGEPRRVKFASVPRSWRGFAIAASIAVVAATSWRLGADHAAAHALADDVLSSHVRSLMPGHLTDVLSSDQHTVKPWFNGRLSFSPPVYDLAARGYPLLGGRLDFVGGQPAAALVYGRRQHMINVFVWPLSEPRVGASESESHGYHTIHWNTAEYSYWIVSDLGVPELREFAGLLQQSDSAGVAPDR